MIVGVNGDAPVSVVVKKPTLPKAPVRYTPKPPASSYYSNTKKITAAAKKTAVSRSMPKTKPAPKPKTVSHYVAPKPAAKAVVKTAPLKPATKVVQAPQATYTPPAYSPTAGGATSAGPSLSTLSNNYLNNLTGATNKIYDQQKTAQLSALKAQNDAAIAKLNQQKNATAQDFYNQKNQADVVNMQNVQRLRELMAANGLNASGENVTAQARANSDRQSALNNLNIQENGKLADLNNQINDINNPARQNAIVANVEAQRSQALLNAQNQAQDKAWREYTYNNMSAAQKAQMDWAKQQYGEEKAWQLYALNATNATNLAMANAQMDGYNSMLSGVSPLGFNSTSGGSGAAGPSAFQSNLAQANQKGVPASVNGDLSWIVQHESSYNPNAKNPHSTAYGYAQFLNSTRADYERATGLSYSNPVNQLVMMYKYCVDRYGSVANAKRFWQQHNWY